MFVGFYKILGVEITTNQNEITQAITAALDKDPTAVIGFVPTMGALHNGHMRLIEEARKNCDIVVCSIFVNPTQFNNPEDLKTYPRTLEADKKLLNEHQCDIVFVPTAAAVYPNGVQPYSINLDGLDEGMEGAFRPGHFKGVCMVVERLFEMVRPHKAFFGYKDFQQVAIIRKMTAVRQLPIEIIGVEIQRADSGLALSSRNRLLTDQQREDAALIYKALKSGLDYATKRSNSGRIKHHIKEFFNGTDMEVEYVAIVDNDTLEPVLDVTYNSSVCIVVYCGEVRLIDNMQFSTVLQPN